MATTITASRQVVEDYQKLFANGPSLHLAVHAAAPGKREALLPPGKQEWDRHTPHADG